MSGNIHHRTMTSICYHGISSHPSLVMAIKVQRNLPISGRFYTFIIAAVSVYDTVNSNDDPITLTSATWYCSPSGALIGYSYAPRVAINTKAMPWHVDGIQLTLAAIMKKGQSTASTRYTRYTTRWGALFILLFHERNFCCFLICE